MFCMNCGTKLPDGAKFCFKCGAKVGTMSGAPEAAPEPLPVKQEEPGLTVHIAGHEISFTKPESDRMKIRNPFREKDTGYRLIFDDIFHSQIESLDDVYSIGVPFMNKAIDGYAELGISILMNYGVDYVSKDMLIQAATDECDENEDFKKFFGIYEKLPEVANEMEADARNIPHWSGGGFGGISAAIKGAVQAEILNIGTKAVYDIANSITGNTPEDKFRRFKNDLFIENDFLTMIKEAQGAGALGVFKEVYKTLCDEGIIVPISFNHKKAIGIMDNLFSVYKNLSNDEILNRFCRAFKLDPESRYLFRLGVMIPRLYAKPYEIDDLALRVGIPLTYAYIVNSQFTSSAVGEEFSQNKTENIYRQQEVRKFLGILQPQLECLQYLCQWVNVIYKPTYRKITLLAQPEFSNKFIIDDRLEHVRYVGTGPSKITISTPDNKAIDWKAHDISFDNVDFDKEYLARNGTPHSADEDLYRKYGGLVYAFLGNIYKEGYGYDDEGKDLESDWNLCTNYFWKACYFDSGKDSLAKLLGTYYHYLNTDGTYKEKRRTECLDIIRNLIPRNNLESAFALHYITDLDKNLSYSDKSDYLDKEFDLFKEIAERDDSLDAGIAAAFLKNHVFGTDDTEKYLNRSKEILIPKIKAGGLEGALASYLYALTFDREGTLFKTRAKAAKALLTNARKYFQSIPPEKLTFDAFRDATYSESSLSDLAGNTSSDSMTPEEKAQKDYETALQILKSDDPDKIRKAIPALGRAANLGHAEAQFIVAGFYEHGLGVEKNKEIALSWYRKAAENNLPAAWFMLGISINPVSPEYQTALTYFKKASDMNYGPATFKLAEAYNMYLGGNKDEELAAKYLKKAAEEGSADALELMGDQYAGNGFYRMPDISTDYDKAISYYEKAIKIGKFYGALYGIFSDENHIQDIRGKINELSQKNNANLKEYEQFRQKILQKTDEELENELRQRITANSAKLAHQISVGFSEYRERYSDGRALTLEQDSEVKAISSSDEKEGTNKLMEDFDLESWIEDLDIDDDNEEIISNIRSTAQNAINGDPRSQFLLGELIIKYSYCRYDGDITSWGQIVEENCINIDDELVIAIMWYCKAAKGGIKEAQDKLVEIKESIKESFSNVICEEISKNGLSYIKNTNNGFILDGARHFYSLCGSFTEAAQYAKEFYYIIDRSKDHSSALKLGYFYATGLGVDQNLPLAKLLFESVLLDAEEDRIERIDALEYLDRFNMLSELIPDETMDSGEDEDSVSSYEETDTESTQQDASVPTENNTNLDPIQQVMAELMKKRTAQAQRLAVIKNDLNAQREKIAEKQEEFERRRPAYHKNNVIKYIENRFSRFFSSSSRNKYKSLTDAAFNGDPDAMLALGKMFAEDKSDDYLYDGAQWFKKANDAGNLSANEEIDKLLDHMEGKYNHGPYFGKICQAAGRYSLAIENYQFGLTRPGYIDPSAIGLGEMYALGQGVQQNKSLASWWFDIGLLSDDPNMVELAKDMIVKYQIQ